MGVMYMPAKPLERREDTLLRAREQLEMVFVQFKDTSEVSDFLQYIRSWYLNRIGKLLLLTLPVVAEGRTECSTATAVICFVMSLLLFYMSILMKPDLWLLHVCADMWCITARSFSHSGQNTNSSIEAYHGVLKSILKVGRSAAANRDPQWLLNELSEPVLRHYQYQVTCHGLLFRILDRPWLA